MKKYLSLILAFVLTLGTAAAYAMYEPVIIKLTPVDPVSGFTANPVYVANTEFCIRCDIDVPRFAKLDNLDLSIRVYGADVTENNVKLAGGTYYIRGVVRAIPATVAVCVADNALNAAETAEEYYIASQTDRSAQAAYIFGSAGSLGGSGGHASALPKTGDIPLFTL